MLNKRMPGYFFSVILSLLLMVSCSPLNPTGIYQISVYVGNQLLHTVIGQTIEIVINKIFDKIFLPPEIMINQDNPLTGTYPGTMTLSSKTPICNSEFQVENPRMCRKSINSPWKLCREEQIKAKKGFSDCLN
ncbi:MAG: hypothetical protein ACRCU2_00840 [Planktothrix sp.]